MVKIVQTAKEFNEPWVEMGDLELGKTYDYDCESVDVSTDVTFQTHRGFGGAFTESAAYTLSNTSDENKKNIISAYFDKEKGLAYNMGRTTIHGCDFSLEPYTYIEEGDSKLETFDMSRDDKYIVPMIKAAEKEAGQKLELLCSPWSPPAFMKTNKDINHGGKLLKEHYEDWAKYMVKYISGMKERGIDMSMVSVQNEPLANQIWASCIYSATDEAEFACDYLYPELQKADMDDVKIVILDHNRDLVYKRAKETMSYKNSEDVVWGVAYHWYCSEKSQNLTMLHNAFPDKHIIFTEGCIEMVNDATSTSSKHKMGAWTHGETYGRNIIKDFNNYCEGWIDWNLVLNEIGGPNYVGNYCESPIMIDRKSDEVMYNASYYYIGHFSKYIKEGAKRLRCMNDAEHDLYSVAYKNPDGEIVTVVQNESDEEKKIALVIDNAGQNVVLPAHSITTFLYKE